MGRRSLVSLLLVSAAATIFFGLGPQLTERAANRISDTAPATPPSARARELYERLFVADLHADSLLWNRDLNDRGNYGHVDVPRLLEGNVAVQAFTVVTRVPLAYDPVGTPDSGDVIGLLALMQRRPARTWTNLTERALHQAAKLQRTADRSRGRLTLLRTAADFETYLAARDGGPDAAGMTAGLLGLEGAHALEDRVENVDVLFDAGFRMIAPTHMFDNALGGSGTGMAKGGLTEFGRGAIARAVELGMIVDLAHASEAVIDELLDDFDASFLVSHTGVRATCDNPRNLSDEHVLRIARKGGLIGVGFFEVAVCGSSARNIAAALGHVARVAGAEHAALGSDFDGAVAMPFDATGLVHIVDELIALGLSEREIALIMGENVRAFLLDALP